MVHINGIYIKNNKLFTVQESIRDYANDDIRYYLCYYVKIAKNYNYGTDRSYEKIGRPFICTKEEIEECEELFLKCKECFFFSVHDDFYYCSQHTYNWDNRYNRLMPCYLFRPGNKPYSKTKCDEQEIRIILEKLFENAKFDSLSGIIIDDKYITPVHGFIGGFLLEDDFKKVFDEFNDSSVTVIKWHLWNLGAHFTECLYSIPMNEFDYSFFNHECNTLNLNLAFLFKESGKVVVIRYEHAYIFDIPS